MTVYALAVSREHVYVPVVLEGVSRAEVEASYAVAVAFLPVGSVPDGATSWVTAEWVATAATLTARVLIGPGSPGPTFSPGDVRDVFARVTGGSQSTVFAVGGLTIAARAASYTDPSTSTRDAVRFEVGDTGPEFEFTDLEVTYALDRAGSVLSAAADLADALAAKLARRAEQESAGDVSVNWGKRAEQAMRLAARLRERAAGEVGTLADMAPIGLGLADTSASGVPYFRRGMHDFPGIEGADVL